MLTKVLYVFGWFVSICLTFNMAVKYGREQERRFVAEKYCAKSLVGQQTNFNECVKQYVNP